MNGLKEYQGYIVLSTESVNRKGFIVRTNSINLEKYKNNPIMLFNHDPKMPIGKFDDFRIIDNVLLAKPIFNEDCPKGKELHESFKNNFVIAASIQGEATIVKPKNGATPYTTNVDISEISLVSVPANAEALKINLSDSYSKIEKTTRTCELSIDNIIQKIHLSYDNSGMSLTEEIVDDTNKTTIINDKKTITNIVMSCLQTLGLLKKENQDEKQVNFSAENINNNETILPGKNLKTEIKLGDEYKDNSLKNNISDMIQTSIPRHNIGLISLMSETPDLFEKAITLSSGIEGIKEIASSALKHNDTDVKKTFENIKLHLQSSTGEIRKIVSFVELSEMIVSGGISLAVGDSINFLNSPDIQAFSFINRVLYELYPQSGWMSKVQSEQVDKLGNVYISKKARPEIKIGRGSLATPVNYNQSVDDPLSLSIIEFVMQPYLWQPTLNGFLNYDKMGSDWSSALQWLNVARQNWVIRTLMQASTKQYQSTGTNFTIDTGTFVQNPNAAGTAKGFSMIDFSHLAMMFSKANYDISEVLPSILFDSHNAMIFSIQDGLKDFLVSNKNNNNTPQGVTQKGAATLIYKHLEMYERSITAIVNKASNNDVVDTSAPGVVLTADMWAGGLAFVPSDVLVANAPLHIFARQSPETWGMTMSLSGGIGTKSLNNDAVIKLSNTKV